MEKEMTEEQVQDHLQEEGGNSHVSFDVTTWKGSMTWVAIGIIAFAIIMILICVL